MLPYRTPSARSSPESADDDDERCPDADLLPGFLVFWIASVARVAFGIMHQETFGAEATLASLAIVVVPYLSRRALVWWIRRRFWRQP